MAYEFDAVLRLLRPVDDNADPLADMSCGRGEAELLGDVDESLRTLELDVIGNLVGHLGCRGSLLLSRRRRSSRTPPPG